jgi:MATH domain/Ankyrin repeats (many copies)
MSRSDYEPDSTTSSCAVHDSIPDNSALLRVRLEDGERSLGGADIMASSAAELLLGQQQTDQQDDSSEQQLKHDNNGNKKNKRGTSSHARGVSEAEPPDTDTETTATSAGAAASHMDDDDGGDHATEDDDGRSQTSMVWKPQNIQSTCEFTHNILDYAQKRESGCKKAEYSAVTTDELGNRWRLIVYVNGNGRASNHHLSLFLQVADADDLPFGWKKSVSYVLTLEHPAGGSLSYAKRNPDKTFKLCPKAIDWGWSQFITSDRIQQEGFVDADSLTVRAQVTVKSSSVEIDEEDAELYLKCAVEEGDANAVKLCLEQGASVNCQFKDDLYTPLHTACSSGTAAGSMEVLQLLLEKGADGNACNKWSETPLLIAANNGHRLAVEALLLHGANPSLCSEAGWSALTFAAHKVSDNKMLHVVCSSSYEIFSHHMFLVFRDMMTLFPYSLEPAHQ